MDPADVERSLASIDTVECVFPDTWGTLVGRRMPAPAFRRAAEHGLSMPNAAFGWDITGRIEATPFTSADTGFPNMHLAPDLDTLRRAPWSERTALCFMDAAQERDGSPHPMSTRGILRRAMARVNDAGYEPWIASELEFYLLTEDGQPIDEDHRCWSMTRGAEYEPVIGAIRAALLGAGIPVESSQTEGGFGQMEINIGPSTPLENADNAALLKYVVKVITRHHGLRATFMPVPFEGADGSGHHLHQSLRAAGQQENLFATRDDLFASYLAGVLVHAADLTAINLPTVNAYKRLEDYTYAPNRVAWALDNRTAAVRIPAGESEARRLEVRIPSADANPYLISATSIASGADGIARGLVPPEPITGDAYQDPTLERFPGSLGEALPRLEASAFVKDVLGAAFVETFSLIGYREEAAFRRSVTQWERARYLDHG